MELEAGACHRHPVPQESVLPTAGCVADDAGLLSPGGGERCDHVILQR